METEETNINNEDQEQSGQDVPSTQEETEETGSEETTEEQTEAAVDAEAEDDKLPFHKNPRWQKVQDELKETRAERQALKDEIASIKTLISDKATTEQKNEAWEKIKELDKEGFTSYEDLTKRIADVVRDEVKKEREDETKSFQEARQANINQMQKDITNLTSAGLLSADEQSDFIDWCAKKLEDTRDADHPQGNIDIYGNLPVAVSYYRHYKGQVKPSDEKTRLERSKIGPSGANGAKSTPVSINDLHEMSMSEAIQKGRKAALTN